jgi:hypothetical protein
LIGLPNDLTRQWMENRLTKQIARVLTSYRGGPKVTVKFMALHAAGATNGHAT